MPLPLREDIPALHLISSAFPQSYMERTFRDSISSSADKTREGMRSEGESIELLG